MKTPGLYLEHILDAIGRIEQYTAGGRDAFLQSPMAQDAVVRNFEIIGEATKHIGDDIRQSCPDIPWRAMAGLRDVLIHDYAGVDIDEVWNVVADQLPKVKSSIRQLRDAYREED